MTLFRNIIRFDRRSTGSEILTPRLLEDAGIEQKERRSIVDSILASFSPRYAEDTIGQH